MIAAPPNVMRAILYGALVAIALLLCWPDPAPPAPARVAIARHNVEQLRARRAEAHQVSEATRPAVVQGRREVVILEPGVLELTLTPNAPPVRFEVPVAVSGALAAERARVVALEGELAVADEQIAGYEELVSGLEEQLAGERKARRWQRLGDVTKGAALGALAGILAAIAF